MLVVLGVGVWLPIGTASDIQRADIAFNAMRLDIDPDPDATWTAGEDFIVHVH